MLHGEAPGVLAGAIALGFVHGIEPGHGWPVAAAYAMDRRNTWAAGFAASLIIGVGHLISSIAVVFAYFYAIAYFDLTGLDEPIVVAGVAIGGPLGIVAGLLLIGLGVREYYGGHAHGVGSEHGSHDDDEEHERGNPDHGGHHHEDHEHDETSRDQHVHDHDHEAHRATEHADGPESPVSAGHDGWRARVRSILPFAGDHQHLDEETAENRGILGIAWVAFVLGFAHEEEFEIIALCTGSSHCLELMLAYALTVVFGIVGLTMALVAGYQHFEQRVEAITPYLPAFSAAVLIVMGVGFVAGIL